MVICRQNQQEGDPLQLYIDGKAIQARPQQSLRELVCALGLDDRYLSRRPLAARIAGEVFTLNYIPQREQEAEGDRPSMRRAMAASGGQVKLLRYGDSAGKDVYFRTAQFVMFLALRQLWPQAVATMDCTLGSSVFVSVRGAADFSAERLKGQIQKIVAQDIPLERRKVSRQEATSCYAAQGQPNKARLLSWQKGEYCRAYGYGGYMDDFLGEMAPSTGNLAVWEVL